MEKKQIDNNNFIVYSPDSLKFITDNLEPILENTIKDYKELFNIKNYRKVQINYFDDLDKFREYIYSLRKEKESLPSYAIGTYDNGMINSYIDIKTINDKDKLHRRIYMASHELFHIMYNELILEKENINRIIWFDEGSAQFFSKEYDNLNNKEEFNKWVKEVKKETKEFPNMNELTHGDKFKTDTYNGYDLSLLAIKYLIDTIKLDEFKKLMHDEKRILEYGKNIIKESFEYYNN